MAGVEIEVTSNYQFLVDTEADETKDTAVLEGSTRSTKTYSILQYLIIAWSISVPGSIIRCFRFDGVTHNTTTIPDFKEIMHTLDLWEGGSWNGQEKVFRFDNGSIFAFSATSDAQKLHGMKQDVAWYNEAMEIDIDAHSQIAFRTKSLTVMDFNPSFSRHWIFDQIIPADSTAYKHSTYKDNPFLTEKQVREIEKYEPTPENIKRGTADAWKYDVYALGKRGKIEGAIFKLFETVDFFPEPHMCQRHGYGLDFGFSLDPTALIECALYQDNLYLREHIYERGLITTTNVSRPSEASIEGRMAQIGVSKDSKIYADCAAPQQIQDLILSGYNVIPCTKGPGSILQGIDLLRQRKMMPTKASVNIQTELEHYKWAKSTHGEFKRKPEDKYNHAIDAIRYWAAAELQQDKFAHGMSTRKIKVKSVVGRRAGRR